MEFHTLNNMFKFSKEFGHTKSGSFDIGETECLICSFIYSHPGCSQDAVAQNLHMDKTTIARALQALETKGYVLRELSFSDRRRKSLHLTEIGTSRITAILELHDRWLNDVMNCLSPEERAQFESYFIRLLERASSMLAKSHENAYEKSQDGE